MQGTANALEYFGGVPRAIIQDNMKSEEKKADRYEADKNRNYLRFSEHYQTTLFPARPNKPKDKAYVEGVVKIIYRRIYAPLRNRSFFSLEELNQAIREMLEKHNDTVLTGHKESRRERFNLMEKEHLGALPDSRYEIMRFETKKVNKFYQIQLQEDKRSYSVPYQYIGSKVEVMYNARYVEVFCKHKRIAWHKGEYDKTIIIDKRHLAPAHRAYQSWNRESILEKAAQIGPETVKYFTELIESKSYPMEAYRICLGIVALSKPGAYGSYRVNHACRRAASYRVYSLKTVESILKKGLDKTVEPQKDYALPTHENIRTTDYY